MSQAATTEAERAEVLSLGDEAHKCNRHPGWPNLFLFKQFFRSLADCRIGSQRYRYNNNVGSGGLYEYLFAKYGYGSGVSYVGNLSGIIRFLGQVARVA